MGDETRKLINVAAKFRENGGGSFWHINVGHIGTVSIFTATILVAYGGMREKFNTVLERSIQNSERIAEIDKLGTVASREKAALDHQILMAHEARLQRTEEAIANIAVMREQIARMSEDVKAIKSKP